MTHFTNPFLSKLHWSKIVCECVCVSVRACYGKWVTVTPEATPRRRMHLTDNQTAWIGRDQPLGQCGDGLLILRYLLIHAGQQQRLASVTVPAAFIAWWTYFLNWSQLQVGNRGCLRVSGSFQKVLQNTGTADALSYSFGLILWICLAEEADGK